MYHDARFRECKTVRHPPGRWCWRRFKISGMMTCSVICRCYFFGWAFCLHHQCSSSLVGFFTYMEMLCNVEIWTPKSWYLCMNLLSPSSKQSKNSATHLCHLSVLIKCNSTKLLSANYHFVLVCVVWFTSCIVNFVENTQCSYTGGEEATLQQANSDLQQWHTLQSLYLIVMLFLELVFLLGTCIILSGVRGGGVQPPPEIPKFWRSWAEFPVLWKVHP